MLFDINPEEASKRLKGTRTLDRFEKENIEFFKRVRQAYLDRATQNPTRFFIVNSMRDKEQISEELRQEFAIWG